MDSNEAKQTSTQAARDNEQHGRISAEVLIASAGMIRKPHEPTLRERPLSEKRFDIALPTFIEIV